MSSSGTDRPPRRRRRWRSALLFLLAVPLAMAAAQLTVPQTASAGDVVNETFQFPLLIDMNTCSTPPEPVALSGDMHIVVTSTSDSSGGYHMTTSSNTQSVTGTGLISGLKYSSSTSDSDEWHAGTPFPQTHTMTHNYVLNSQGGTANTVMKITFHVTVNANGIPTAYVDNVKSGCQG